MRASATSIMLALLLWQSFSNAAPQTQPSRQTRQRTRVLLDHLKTFRLDLSYDGPQDKPFYRLILSTEPVEVLRSSEFELHVQISEAQARKIIEHLASSGFLDHAADVAQVNSVPLKGPCYTMMVYVRDRGPHDFYDSLGWEMPMLKRMDALRSVLDGEAAKQMDLLLGRLNGLRKQWEKESKSH